MREEVAEPLRHRRVRENGVTQPRIWQVCQHRRLHRGHDLAGLGADHREAENAVVARADKNLHEALRFVRRRRPSHAAHRQPRDTHAHTLMLRFAFAQSDMSQWRLSEHAVWNQPITRAALPSGEIVSDDPKIVDRDVSKLWAAGAFPDRPDIGRRRLQPLIDANVATAVHLDRRLIKPDSRGVWNASCRDQDVATVEFLLAGSRAHGKADFLSGPAVYIEGLGRD